MCTGSSCGILQILGDCRYSWPYLRVERPFVYIYSGLLVYLLSHIYLNVPLCLSLDLTYGYLLATISLSEF
jgi:hypothetical protein